MAGELVETEVFPFVREITATAARIKGPVVMACKVLALSKQTYYQWLDEPFRSREGDDAHALPALRERHEDDPRFRFWFPAKELADMDITCSENRSWNLRSKPELMGRLH